MFKNNLMSSHFQQHLTTESPLCSNALPVQLTLTLNCSVCGRLPKLQLHLSATPPWVPVEGAPTLHSTLDRKETENESTSSPSGLSSWWTFCQLLTFFAVEGEQRLSLVVLESVLQVVRASQCQSVNPGPLLSRLGAVRQHRLRGGENVTMVHILSLITTKVALRCCYLDGNSLAFIQSSGVSQFHGQWGKLVDCGHGHLSRVWPGNEKSIATGHTQIWAKTWKWWNSRASVLSKNFPQTHIIHR